MINIILINNNNRSQKILLREVEPGEGIGGGKKRFLMASPILNQHWHLLSHTFHGKVKLTCKQLLL